MKLVKNKLQYSASDLVNYFDCRHLSELHYQQALGLLEKNKPLQTPTIIKKGLEHEKKCADKMRSEVDHFVDIDSLSGGIKVKAEGTISAIQSRADVIYQATFLNQDEVGIVDFLVKCKGICKYGNYSYEIWDSKLSKNEKNKYLLQLLFYCDLVSAQLGTKVQTLGIIFGDMSKISYRVDDYHALYQKLKGMFYDDDLSKPSYPFPCNTCRICEFKTKCDKKREDDNHISLLPGVNKKMINALNKIKINSVDQVIDCGESKMSQAIGSILLSNKLKHHAKLRMQKLQKNQPVVELITQNKDQGLFQTEAARGFLAMPKPSRYDIYFDLEGDPFNKLEYLWGIYVFDGTKYIYQHWFSHNKEEEKQAFSKCINFIQDIINEHPDAHIYHYANYEVVALKKCMGQYGIGEDIIDNWLRKGTLIDLYRIVVDSVRISESNYSLKSLETFYDLKRTEEIKDGGESIEIYEQWKNEGGKKYLESLAEYNKIDVISTYKAHQWLLGLRPETLPFDKKHKEGLAAEGGKMSENEIKLDYRALFEERIKSKVMNQKKI